MSQMFKIFIGNVSFKTTEDHLRPFLEPHLEIEDLLIARDETTGKSKGYGFVMTRDPVKGRAAMRRIGKFELDGRRIYLKEAHGKKNMPKPRNKRPGGFGGGGGGGGGGDGQRGGPRPYRPAMRRNDGGPSRGENSFTRPASMPAARETRGIGYIGIETPAAPLPAPLAAPNDPA